MATSPSITRRAAVIGALASTAALATPASAEGKCELPEHLKRYVGTPEFEVMAAINMLSQVAREYDPSIRTLVHWTDDDMTGRLILSGVVFDRRS